MFNALMGRFHLELFILITYFSIVVPLNSYVFFPVGLLSLMRHFQQARKENTIEWDDGGKIGNKNK